MYPPVLGHPLPKVVQLLREPDPRLLPDDLRRKSSKSPIHSHSSRNSLLSEGIQSISNQSSSGSACNLGGVSRVGAGCGHNDDENDRGDDDDDDGHGDNDNANANGGDGDADDDDDDDDGNDNSPQGPRGGSRRHPRHRAAFRAPGDGGTSGSDGEAGGPAALATAAEAGDGNQRQAEERDEERRRPKARGGEGDDLREVRRSALVSTYAIY